MWNHSESKKRLHVEQLQLEALAGSSIEAHSHPNPLPGASDYELRKQERMQAIRSVFLTSAHPCVPQHIIDHMLLHLTCSFTVVACHLSTFCVHV